MRQLEFVFGARKRFGDVFVLRGLKFNDLTVTSHPDHVRSLFTAKSEHAPSLASESALRLIVGSTSVFTSVGARHMRQRRLLLPPFHGEAVARYVAMIEEAAMREIASWPLGRPFALVPRMRAITLDVIMNGIFGIVGRPSPGTPEYSLRRAVKWLMAISSNPFVQVAELLNAGHDEAKGVLKAVLVPLDRAAFAVIAARRRSADLAERSDILSLLLQSTAEDGKSLSDRELRDELLALLFAGHETTANSLAWAWERVLRTPAAHERLLAAVRDETPDREAVVEATLHEAMRSRPAIPMVGRCVKVPWLLGDVAVPAGAAVGISILLVHHREDLYPEPFSFRPERFLGQKPGTYTWLPFGGGIRRCIGASLAMAEQSSVLKAIARTCDLVAAEPEPEPVLHRNVTMLPARGARVVLRERRAR